MRIFVRELRGYSAETVENVWNATRLTEDSSGIGERPAGVCFIAGPDSLSLARRYAFERRQLGTVTFHAGMMTDTLWQALFDLLTSSSAHPCYVGYVIHSVDCLSREIQKSLADLVARRRPTEWFMTAEVPMQIIPELREQFVVYLGLDAEDHMKFLIQKHTLWVDRDNAP